MAEAAAAAAAAISAKDRALSALRGLIVGDAFNVPVHWYYDTAKLKADIGDVTEMLASKPFHAQGPGGPPAYKGTMDIIHYKAEQHAALKKAANEGIEGEENQRNVHYHATLARGQNAIDMCVVRLGMRYMAGSDAAAATEEGGGGGGADGGAADHPDGLRSQLRYDPEEFLQAMEKYVLTPPPANAATTDPGQLISHNDFYVDSYMRAYFEARSKGVPATQAASSERTDSGVDALDGAVFAVPIIVAHRHLPEAELVALAIEHAKLTHDSVSVFSAITVIAPLLKQLLAGADPDDALRAAAGKINPPAQDAAALFKSFRSKMSAWEKAHTFKPVDLATFLTQGDGSGSGPLLDKEPADVIGVGDRGQAFASWCGVEHALPATLYLALKFGDDFLGALRANASVGGHNTARGSLLGAIIGARTGKVPQALFDGLAAPAVVDATVTKFVEASTQQ